MQILSRLPREIADFIPYLPSDDRVDILDVVERKSSKNLPMVPTEDQSTFRTESAHPERESGAEMSTDHNHRNEGMTFRQALDEISQRSTETLNYLYVVDDQGKPPAWFRQRLAVYRQTGYSVERLHEAGHHHRNGMPIVVPRNSFKR